MADLKSSLLPTNICSASDEHQHKIVDPEAVVVYGRSMSGIWDGTHHALAFQVCSTFHTFEECQTLHCKAYKKMTIVF